MSPNDILKGTVGARGFAGLRDLAAQVSLNGLSPIAPDLRAEPLEHQPAAPPTSSVPDNQEPYQGPSARKSIFTRRNQLIVGGVIAIAVIWAVADQRSNSGNTSATPETTYTQAPPEALAEVRPPVGTDIVLSSDQILYCLSEKIRLEGAQGAVSTYSQSEVDRFNAMINDYNSRCASFRYQAGTLEAIQAQVEANASHLRSEGAARFP